MVGKLNDVVARNSLVYCIPGMTNVGNTAHASSHRPGNSCTRSRCCRGSQIHRHDISAQAISCKMWQIENRHKKKMASAPGAHSHRSPSLSTVYNRDNSHRSRRELLLASSAYNTSVKAHWLFLGECDKGKKLAAKIMQTPAIAIMSSMP